MDAAILDALKAFTQDQAGRDPRDIKETTFLEKDLGIYGDDAVEYVIAFGKHFNVDVSKFMADDYFSPEGGLANSFFGRLFGMNTVKYKDLSIAHLIKAVKAGRLDEEVINGQF